MFGKWFRRHTPATENFVWETSEIPVSQDSEQPSENPVTVDPSEFIKEEPDGLELPIPVPALTAEEKDQLEVWLSMGVRHGMLLLRRFLAGHRIPVYDGQKVIDLFDGRGQSWHLHPLRKEDIIPDDGICHLFVPSPRWPKWISAARTTVGGRAEVFHGVVPADVLRVAAKLRREFYCEVRFIVWSSKKDRFLAVSVNDCAMHLVARWSE